LLKSASVKLVVAYVVLFTVSVGILAAVVYTHVTAELNRELRARIVADADALSAGYASGGTAQLLQAIAERQHNRLVGGLDYALVDAQRHQLVGSMRVGRCVRGWMTVNGPPDGDEPAGEMEKLAVYVAPLSHGECLLVGDDIGKIYAFGSLVLKTFGWTMVLSVLLAVAGGLFLSSRVFRRIEAITSTAEAIIEGDLRQRVPRRGVSDDLDRLAATLNKMLDRMTSLMESLRHVSNDVAHDLRTPLGRLRHFLAEATLEEMSAGEYRAVLEGAIAEVDGILETFGAILRIAQIEGGSRRHAFRHIEISTLVADVCETFAPVMEDAGKTLHMDIQPEVWIHGDRELLTQSLANLLENAIVHTPAGADVNVAVRRNDRTVELDVADNGIGVPEAEHKRIFERFYRLERSRTAAGNGLGLSIVAAVAELHDATISVGSNNPGLRIAMRFAAA
jgi:signal transduction histidine kinase